MDDRCPDPSVMDYGSAQDHYLDRQLGTWIERAEKAQREREQLRQALADHKAAIRTWREATDNLAERDVEWDKRVFTPADDEEWRDDFDKAREDAVNRLEAAEARLRELGKDA